MSYVKQCAGGMVLISEEIPSFNVLILPNGRKTKTIYFCLHASKKKPYVSLGGMVFKTIACQKGKKMVPHRSVYVPFHTWKKKSKFQTIIKAKLVFANVK